MVMSIIESGRRICRPFFLVLLLFATRLEGQAGRAAGAPLRDFDAYVNRALAQWKVPGVAIAVVRGDSVILLRGYGVRQAGRPEPVTAHTMFEIGSTSKAFSSALLAMLMDDGKLTWDDPVIRHLPWFELRDPFVTREVTLRDLLSHRVGVNGIHNGLLTSTRTEIIRKTRYLEPNLGFRTKYDYSNMMYATAGEVAATVAGKPWEELLRERILTPLGMRETTTDISRFFDSTHFAHCFYCPLPKHVTLDQVLGHQDVALPHQLVHDSIRAIPWQSYDNAVSAGSVISNATDMAQWLRFLLGEGTYQGKTLVRAATFREMHQPQSIIQPSGWLGTVARLSPSSHFWSYGLGWRLNDYRGRKIVWHTGGIIGFLAYVGLVPEERLGIVILSNGDLGSDQLLPPALAYRLIDEQIGSPVRDWSTELATAIAAERRVAPPAAAPTRAAGKPSLPLDQYVGAYQNDIYGDVTVELRDGHLHFSIPNGARGDLEHLNYDAFQLELDATWAGNFPTLFRIGRSGKVEEMSIEGVGDFLRKQ